MQSTAFPWSFHTHSEYCDGAGTPMEVVEAAVELGLTDLGFSSHLPLPFPTGWNMPPDRLEAYSSQVRSLKDAFAGRINLWLGGELDYMDDAASQDFQADLLERAGLEYCVGSVHFLGPERSAGREFDGTEEGFRTIVQEDYGGDMEAMARDYYRRVAALADEPAVRIIGHFDLIKRWNHERQYFRGDEDWYHDAVEGALRAIARSQALVELNTAGWRKGLSEPYPAEWILNRCKVLGMPVTVSADAHVPGQLADGYDRAAEVLAALGIDAVNPARRLQSA